MKCFKKYLHQGPMILEGVCGFLLRFRIKRIGIIADIEKAILSAGQSPEDRDLTRFLWLKEVNGKTTDYVSICKTFLLSATVKHHPNEANAIAAKQIEDKIYVNN